ncbi:MAG: alpha-L-rhamnosidase C-terminal domain-containing protein [Bacteroidota bacterium]
MRVFFTIVSFLSVIATCNAQYPPSYDADITNKAEKDPLTRVFLSPQRIVWKTSESLILNSEVLLKKGVGQPYFGTQSLCKIINKEGQLSGLILDFGKEIHGGVQITTSQGNNVTRKVRLRFGESVSETNTETMNIPSGKDGSTNHHGMRDFDLTLPGYATIEVGNTGFRFLRIDLLDANAELVLKEVRAISKFRDIPYLGSFKCNDEQLNKIWQTGAYTAHLCMTDYVIDGIKRDRMVWSGDIHPQLMTISHVFGYQEVVPKSLDFLRDTNLLPKFINGIPSYSLWWIIMQHDWYQYHGRLDYLKEQKTYLVPLLDQLSKYVDNDGNEILNVGKSMRFIDWPSYKDKAAVHAGIQAMMAIAFEKGAVLCDVIGEKSTAEKYTQLASKMKKQLPDANNSKQAAALLSLSGMADAKQMNEKIISVDGAKNFGAFFGYYMLEAQAKAEDYTGALNNIRQFWGGMLDLGATTFWEEFDIDEAKGAARIDEIVPAGKKDYHLSTGIECYKGIRRSLCHGWSSGPTAWLSEHVLGIKILEPGAKKVKIEPHLGDLEWVEGTFPTAYGVIYVKHIKQKDGKIKTEVKAPKEVQVVQ